MKRLDSNFFLRFSVIVILLIHGVAGMFNNGINDFGTYFLNEVGFSPIGVQIAWAIKLTHIVAVISLIVNRYVKIACWANILILIMGIVLVHFKEGWFVVGGGRNGVEFNFLLIFVLLAIIFQKPSIEKNISVD